MPFSPAPAAIKSIDECVRAVTAFESFDDLKATQQSYAPTFYAGRSTSAAELRDMRRVVYAFNSWALRAGREPRAEVHLHKSAR